MLAFGFLNLDKPAGETSRQVVNHVQRLVRPAKVGHAGTLDPLATGVLVVPVGPATRLIEHVHRLPKHYAGTFLLGRTSPTEDVDGTVTELTDPPVPSLEEITEACQGFVGRIQQRPPIFSALKVKGQRAYDLARRGQTVELKPRWIEVHRLEVVSYCYPELQLDIACGSGTYVRSLGRDLAESLGTEGVMSALVRTRVGPFRLEEAYMPQAVTETNWRELLLSPRMAIAHLPHLTVSDEQLVEIRSGRTITGSAPCQDTHEESGGVGKSSEIAALNAAGKLVAILAPRGPVLLGPKRNFPDSDS